MNVSRSPTQILPSTTARVPYRVENENGRLLMLQTGGNAAVEHMQPYQDRRGREMMMMKGGGHVEQVRMSLPLMYTAAAYATLWMWSPVSLLMEWMRSSPFLM